MIAVKVPDANAKKKVPDNIRKTHMTFSILLNPDMSPYPTVVIVVTVK